MSRGGNSRLFHYLLCSRFVGGNTELCCFFVLFFLFWRALLPPHPDICSNKVQNQNAFKCLKQTKISLKIPVVVFLIKHFWIRRLCFKPFEMNVVSSPRAVIAPGRMRRYGFKLIKNSVFNQYCDLLRDKVSSEEALPFVFAEGVR